MNYMNSKQLDTERIIAMEEIGKSPEISYKIFLLNSKEGGDPVMWYPKKPETESTKEAITIAYHSIQTENDFWELIRKE